MLPKVFRTLPFVGAISALLLSACAAGPGVATPEPEEPEEPVLVGEVSRGEIEAEVPEWTAVSAGSEIDPMAAAGLSMVEPGASVEVFFGTWCGDSKREVARLWRALDEIASAHAFDLSYVAVDRDKEEPSRLVEGRDILYVPTFIVSRDGREVGRIVETSPSGIEVDLLALLEGEAEGVLSESRPELTEAGTPETDGAEADRAEAEGR